MLNVGDYVEDYEGVRGFVVSASEEFVLAGSPDQRITARMRRPGVTYYYYASTLRKLSLLEVLAEAAAE